MMGIQGKKKDIGQEVTFKMTWVEGSRLRRATRYIESVKIISSHWWSDHNMAVIFLS